MGIRDCKQVKFTTTDNSTFFGVEVIFWSDINDLAMRNGWMNSSLRYIGMFKIDDCDDTFALFHDTEDRRNYALNF